MFCNWVDRLDSELDCACASRVWVAMKSLYRRVTVLTLAPWPMKPTPLNCGVLVVWIVAWRE